MMCVVGMWSISFFFANLFACGTRFSAYWGSTIDLITKCVKTLKLLYGLSVSDFVTDLIIIITPMPFVSFF